MSFDLSRVFDPIFLAPFLNGLLLALLLPVLGAYVRMREEWLSSLGVAQVAGAGVVLGAVVGYPGLPAALAAAAFAVAAKTIVGRAGNDNYGMMILAGWTLSLLAAANAAHGGELARAVSEGQLYFSNARRAAELGGIVLVAAAALPWLSPRLLLGRLFPDHFRANARPAWRHELAFDLLAASALALASTTIGVMAAFALVFVPPWVAFRRARGWRRSLLWSAGFGVASYLVAFAAAIMLDQPFGPVLVAVLLPAALLRLFRVRA